MRSPDHLQEWPLLDSDCSWQAILPDLRRETALDWLCYTLPTASLPRALATGGATQIASAAPVKVVAASDSRPHDPVNR